MSALSNLLSFGAGVAAVALYQHVKDMEEEDEILDTEDDELEELEDEDEDKSETEEGEIKEIPEDEAN